MNKQVIKSTSIRLLYIFIVHFFLYSQVFGQTIPIDTSVNQSLTSNDSIQETKKDSTYTSTTSYDTVNIVYDDGDIEEPITYSATDSIVYDMKNQKLLLFGSSKMKYTTIDIQSEQIEYDWVSSTLTARGKVDSTGLLTENAKFTESSGEYLADSMQYNFKTKKGRTYDVVTEQDGAYIHSEIVQKNQYEEWYGYKTKYTTCTNPEHPHFYLGANKSKVIPGKVMVTGPVNLVVADINTPLYLPFGIFPTKAGRRSGIVMPEYGEQPSLGFFLKNGGYYWAVNDNLSLTFLGDIYTRGRFGLSVDADYRKIYKYQGSLFFKYFRTPPEDRFLSNTGTSNDYRIEWSHTMDSKARPNNSFSASVTGASSNYNGNSLQTTEQLLEVQLTSNVTYTRRFSKINSNFQISARHNQNLQTRKIDLTLPELSFNASRFTPFQKKIQTEKKMFYEKIGITYTSRAKAAISTYDSLFLRQENLDDIQYGMMQTARVDMPFNLAKFFTVNPSFNYNERWYFKQEDRTFFGDSLDIDDDGDLDYYEYTNQVNNGFFGLRDFNFSTDIATTVTGIYNFKTKNVKAIRHIIKPTINYTLSPDFGAPRWNYVDTYYNSDTQEDIEYNRYSTYNNLLYGTPSGGLQNLITFNLRNNFEMKVVDRKDSLQNLKKVSLLEQLNLSTGYNFTADSLKIQPFIISAQSSLFSNLISWNIGATLDPYAINESRQKINQTQFQVNKRLLRFDRANVALQFNLNPKAKNKMIDQTQYGTLNEREYIANNPQMFYDFDIPWSLSVGYRLNITKGVSGNIDSTAVTANSLTLSGHINITPKWQINLSTGYDLRDKDLTLTNLRVERDLHCWVLAFNWTAYPLNRQTYSIDLHVKSPILQELKLSRKQPVGTTSSVF